MEKVEKKNVTITRIPLLIVTHLAAASIASRSVNTILLTQVISGRTFVQVPAADAVGVQNKT